MAFVFLKITAARPSRANKARNQAMPEGTAQKPSTAANNVAAQQRPAQAIAHQDSEPRSLLRARKSTRSEERKCRKSVCLNA